jgi:transposase
VIADRAYDAYAILDHVEAIGAIPIIPQKTCMPRARAFDPVIYKQRNRIERTIGKLKQLRRIATRYDRLPENYLAGLYLASLSFWSC